MTDTHAPITEPHLSPMFDTGALPNPTPNTEPHPAPIFDTGPHPDPLNALRARAGEQREHVVEADAQPVPEPMPEPEPTPDAADTDAFLRPVVIPAQPVAVPGSYQFVKRWKFALIVAGVWVIAAAVGLGFYYWWYTSLTKTVPVFGILLYVVACMTAAILLTLIPNRPQVTALAIALMAAPLASVSAAAVLHGAFYFEWIARPAIG